MDILTGLSATSLAIGIVKELRGIDRSVDEAAYKLKLAELIDTLADAKLAMADAKLRISTLEDELATLKNGELCPMCRVGRLRVKGTELAFSSNSEFHKCECNNESCDYSNSRIFDPSTGKYKGQIKGN